MDEQVLKMKTVENFMSDFHNLPGINFREKQKYFQNFISEINQKLPNKNDENKLIAELKPRNKLEHLLRIDLLSHLKRNEELLEILKTGNRNYIGKVLKNYQFFADVIPKFDADTLINNLFPQTSFVTKSKIINRIYKTVKNEQLVDEYFVAIEEKYGFRLAFALLPGCSVKLIKLKVNKYKPKLQSRHVIEIYKKEPQFPSFYFNVLKTQDDNFDFSTEYPSVIKYIARKNPELFWKLQNEFNFNFKSGKHLTKKLILQNQEVLKDGKKCVTWFQKNKLYNIVNEQGKMQDFLFSFYEDTAMEFLEKHIFSHSDMYKMLKFLTPEKRYNLLHGLFNKKYSKDILSYQMKFPQRFLELLPLAVREPIVEKHLEKRDDYTYLLNSTKAISLLKEMLQNCSTSEQRSEKLQDMCKTLEMNRNDKEKVTDVFKFVFERYRNDLRALKAFVYTFTDDDKNLNFLDGDQLKLLNQMGLYTITEYSNRDSAEKISTVYLLWLIENNKDYDDHLMDYLKRVSLDHMYYNTIFEWKFREMKTVLEKIIDAIDKFKDNEKAYNKLAIGLTNHIVSYNKQHKKNLIPLVRYKHILEYSLKHGNAYTNSEFYSYIMKNYYDENLYRYFWEHYKQKNEFDKLYWFLKNDIKQIEENLDLILSNPPHADREYIYRCFEKYSTESLKEKMIEHIKTKISFEKSSSMGVSISILSFMDSEIFLKTTAPFMPPPDGKLDMENAPNKIIVQKAIIRSLRNIEHENLLEIVRNVCVGDYLKYGLQPLYKIIYNMRETDILPLLNDLKQAPVSVGKHSLLLARHLLPTKEALEFIHKSLQKEGNVSMRNVIFKKSLDIFLDTQTEPVWKQLHNNFQIINSESTAMLGTLIKYIRKIPPVHVISYIQSTYDAIKKSKSKQSIKKIIFLAKNIPQSVLEALPFTFLEEIIEKILQYTFLHEHSEDCFWNFIIHTSSNRSKQLLSCTLEIMKTIISDTNPGYAKLRTSITNFTTSFCKKILKQKNIEHKQIVEMFDLQWSFFPQHCLLDAVLLIKITMTYYESEFDLNKFAFSLNKLLHKYIEEYDSNIILDFSNQLITMCNLADVKNDALPTFADLLMRCNDNKYNYILIINLLPKGTFPVEDNKYYEWVGIIKSMEEYGKKGRDGASVMFHYDKYLRENRNEYVWIGNQQFPPVTTTKL